MNRLLHISGLLFFGLILGTGLCQGHETGKKDSLDQRLQLFKKGKLKLSLDQQIDLYNALANEFKFRYPDSTLFYVQKALRLNDPIHYERGYIISNIRYGDYFGDIGEVSQASQKYQVALGLIDTDKNPEIEVDLLQGMALHSFFNERNEDWYAYLQRAIDAARRSSRMKRLAVLIHIEGFLLYNYQLYEESAQSQAYADSLFNALGVPEMSVTTQTNLAQNALDWGKIETFKKHADSTLSMLSRKPDFLWEIRIAHVLSKFHLTRTELSKAFYWNNRAFRLLDRITLPREKLENHRLRAGIYLGQKKIDSAQYYAQSVKRIATQTNDSISLGQSLLYLSQIAALKGNKDSSMVYLSKHAEIQSMANAISKTKRLRLIQNQYNLRSEQLTQRQALEQEAMSQRIALALILLAVIVLSTITLLLWIRKKRQEKIQAKLLHLGTTKDRIFSMVSNDLLTPIIELKNTLARYDSERIDQTELFQTLPSLKSKVELSSFTLNNLLYWAQSQMPEFKPNQKEIALKERTALICEHLSTQIKQKKIKISCNIPENSSVLMDINHLDIVLKNVIYNAIKFSPLHGSIEFNAQNQKENVVLEILNTGNSICPLLAEAIQNGQNYPAMTGTLDESGSGFGLKVTQELIRKNKGQLQILPLPNKGTLIRIFLPNNASVKVRRLNRTPRQWLPQYAEGQK